MRVESKGIVDGVILDKFGKRGRAQRFGMPTCSVPFQIFDTPAGTKSFVVIFDDPDAAAVCGKVWDHWLVANLHKTNVEEDESENSFDFVQGLNGWHDNSYGGPCPPDRPHKYVLNVFALDCDLPLKGGFSRTQLEREMHGHVIEKAFLTGIYAN